VVVIGRAAAAAAAAAAAVDCLSGASIDCVVV